MTRELMGRYGAVTLVLALFGIGGACTPTEREFTSGGAGGGCPAGFVECDGDPETVCETDTTTTREHCGECNNACADAPYANVACVDGKCAIPSCNDGRENCDDFYENGCETNPTTSFEHCGTCDNSCEAPQAITACVTGTCQLAQCVMGYLDCDMDTATGCEVDPKTNADHCGSCGMKCTAPNAMMGCMDSTCVLASCNKDFLDCNMVLSDGCEVNSQTDHKNCGTCGISCGGGACNAGMCSPPMLVVKAAYQPGELALHNGYLYVASRTPNGEIGKLLLPGGPLIVIGTTMAAANAIFVNDAGIFVGGGSIMARISPDGLNYLTYSNSGTVRGIAADLKDVYWSASTAIRSGPVGGGNSVIFASALTTSYAVAVDATDVYWTLADGSIWRAPIAAPAPVQITLGPPTATNMVIDATHAYWSSAMGIHSVPLAGGMPQMLAPGNTSVRAMAIDDTYVYWTDDSIGEVRKVRKDGSEPFITIASGPLGVWGVAVDAQYVYWSNFNTLEIWKVLH